MALWRAIQLEYRIDDSAAIELLTQACEASDRIAALSARIAEDGEIITTRSGLRAHPALREELQGRAFVVKTLEKLGLTLEPVRLPGRPPGRKALADQ